VIPGTLQEVNRELSGATLLFMSPARIDKILIEDPYDPQNHSSGIECIVDTGAAITVIPANVVDRLGLTAWGTLPVSAFGQTSEVDYPLYHIRLTLPGIRTVSVDAIGCVRDNVLLGRDVFRRGKLQLLFDACGLRWRLKEPSLWARMNRRFRNDARSGLSRIAF